MELNTDFYSVTQSDIGNGLKILNKEVVAMLNDGDLPFNEEWDLSLSPWCIGTGADWFNLAIPLMYAPTDDVEDVVFQKYPFFDDNNNTGYPFWFGTNNAYAGNWSNEYCWNYKNAYSVQHTSEVSWRNRMKPIVNFKYNELIFHCLPVIDGVTRDMSFVENLWNTTPITSKMTGFTFAGYYRKTSGSMRVFSAIGMGNLCKGNPIEDPDIPSSAAYNIPWLDYCLHPITTEIIQYQTESLDLVRTKEAAANYELGYSFNKSSLVPVSDLWKQTFGVSGYNYNMRWYCGLPLDQFQTFEAFKEYFCTQCAYIGTFFTFDGSTAQNADLSGETFSNNVYLGIINDNGITTGEYLQGTDISDSEQSTWEDPWQSSPWEGFENIDPNTYSNSTSWNTPAVSGFSSFSKAYKLNVLDVIELHSKFYESLSGIPAGTTVTDYFEGTYLTNNPTDVIISLRYYEINLAAALPGDTATNLYLGSYNTGMQAVETQPLLSMYNLGSCVYYPHFHDFRDYEPYSYAELIVPYCGTVKISPADFMNHTLSVKMSIDFSTGACTAYVFRDSLMIESISGQYGVEIPVSAVASSDLQRDIFNNANALKQARIASAQNLTGGLLSIVGGIVTQNPLAIAGGIASTIFGQEKADTAIEAAEYNLEHTKVNFKTAGAASPGLNVLQEQNARLIIYRPVMASDYDPEAYARTTGFATITNAALSEFTGFTKCATVKADGIPATATEKNMIIKALQAGVYL